MTKKECHCGKDGWPLHSVQCPIHGGSRIRVAEMTFALMEARSYIMGHPMGCPGGYPEGQYIVDLIDGALGNKA